MLLKNNSNTSSILLLITTCIVLVFREHILISKTINILISNSDDIEKSKIHHVVVEKNNNNLRPNNANATSSFVITYPVSKNNNATTINESVQQGNTSAIINKDDGTLQLSKGKNLRTHQDLLKVTTNQAIKDNNSTVTNAISNASKSNGTLVIITNQTSIDEANPEDKEDSIPSQGIYNYPPVVVDDNFLSDDRNNNNQNHSSLGGVKVMLFITTHMSLSHKWYLKSCWPPALDNSILLRHSDIVVYLNPPEIDRKESIEILQKTFSKQNLTIHVRENQGKQVGAMAPLKHAKMGGWFNNGYDWIIRVNPDVIIRNDTFLVQTMQNDPNATGLFVDCNADKRAPDHPRIHTDFFAIKPEVFAHSNAFENTKGNAENSFTRDVQELILNKGNHRWIPGADHRTTQCRVAFKKQLHTTPITHKHYQEEQMKEFGNTCPIPF